MRDAHDLDERVALLRQSLTVVRPDLAHLPIALALHAEQSNPAWQRCGAFVGDDYVAKFAWTDAAARRLRTEISIRRTLAGHETAIPVPELVVASNDPPLLISRFVPGSPVTGTGIAQLTPGEKGQLAGSLAGTLRALHAPGVLALVNAGRVPLDAPTPQADTAALRQRFTCLVDDAQAALVERWADWIDATLSEPVAVPTFLHGDFHGHNLVLNEHHEVRALLDFEEPAIGDRHYDFRYLPAQEATLELFVLVVAEYERRAALSVDIRRVMAWHVRTVLGDALWRTETGVALPEHGTPSRWVEELRERFDRLDIRT
jgi:aminoglycoside phosphotransferase (APT) family kinase protein